MRGSHSAQDNTDAGSFRESARLRMMLTAILAVGLGLRLWHLHWGLPDVYEEAYPFHNAWKYWNWNNPGWNFNPHFFHYPALSFHLQFVVQVAHFLVGRLFGIYSDLDAYQSAYQIDPTTFFVLARLVSVLLDVGTIGLVYVIARRFVRPNAALAAATLVSVNVLLIRYAQTVNVDTPVTFFTCLACYCLVRLYQTPGTKWYILSGITIGLACATKYTAGLLLVMLVAAHLLRSDSLKTALRSLRSSELWGTVILTGLVFLQMNPFVVLNWTEFVRDFTFEQAHVQSGHLGLDPSQTTVGQYFLGFLPENLGWPLLVVTIGSIGLLAWKRRREDFLLLVFPLVYFAIIATWAMRADRYLLPIIPLLVIIAVRGLEELGTMFHLPETVATEKRTSISGISRGIVAPAVLIVLAAGPVNSLLEYQQSRSLPDTRTISREWIISHVPLGSGVALGPLGLNLPVNRYLLLSIPFHPLQPEFTAPFYNTRWYTDLDIVVGSSFDYARYAQEPAKYKEFIAFYDSLRSGWRMVYSIRPAEHQSGPEIWLFRPPIRTTAGEFDSTMMRSLSKFGNTTASVNFAGKLGVILSAKGILDRSIQLLRYVVRADRSSSVGYRELGGALFKKGDFEEALAATDISLQLTPNDPEMLVIKGRLLTVLKRAGEAEPFLRRALELDRFQEAAYVALADLYEGRGERRRLIDILRQYRSILPAGDPKLKLLDERLRLAGG